MRKKIKETNEKKIDKILDNNNMSDNNSLTN